MTYEQAKNSLTDYPLESRDFNDGYKAKVWWKKELKKFAKMDASETIEHAKFLLDYLYDFSKESYYVKDEIKGMLKDLISKGKAQ